MTSHPAGESRRKPRLAGAEPGCEVQAKILIQRALLNCSERLVEVHPFLPNPNWEKKRKVKR